MSRPDTNTLMEKYRQAQAVKEDTRREQVSRPMVDAFAAVDLANAELARVMAEHGYVASRRGMWRCIVCQDTFRYPRQCGSHRLHCSIPSEAL